MSWFRCYSGLQGELVRVVLPIVVFFAPTAWGQAVVIGAEDDAAPWSYADGTGYVNDLVRAVFESVGWRVELKVMPYARCKAMALSGALAGCFTTSKVSELDGKLIFPQQAVFDAQNVLVTKASSPLKGCDPAGWGAPPTIGTVRGYEYNKVVGALFKSNQARSEEANSEVSNLRKVKAGHVDAALITIDAVKRLEFVVAQANVGGDFSTVCNFGGELGYVAFSLANAQGRPAAVAFEQGFAKLERSGSIAALQQRWRTQLLDSVRTKKH